MSTFGWDSPFPLRLGGSGHVRVRDAYNAIRANIGDAFTDDEDTATVAETKAAARALAHAESAIDRYVAQADPSKLTQLLERWEAILGITPSIADSDADRRRAVASRLTSNYSGTAIELSRLAAEAFSPWSTNLVLTSADEAVSYWPGGTTSATFPWYSTVCNVCVEYIRPAYASDEDCEKRRSICMAALEGHAPAWSILTISETQSTGDNANVFGFFLDQPNLDVSAFGV